MLRRDTIPHRNVFRDFSGDKNVVSLQGLKQQRLV